jgi:hypothetical protein
MEQALETTLSSKPFVKGTLITDQNGLCIAAKVTCSSRRMD